MRKIILFVIFVIVTFMIVQTIRYNSKGRNVQNLEFTNLNNQKVKLKDVFNKMNNKYILYIYQIVEVVLIRLKNIRLLIILN